MVFSKNTKILFFTVFLPIIFQVQSEPQVSRRDLSSLINLLTKNSDNKRPIVLILSSGTNKVQKYPADTSNEIGHINIPHLLLQHTHKAKTRSPIKKGVTKSLLQLKKRDRQLQQLQRLRSDSLEREDRDALRSPIIKKLLRISNKLQCNAKDECEDKCSDKYKGKMVIKCKVQCEVKYVCEEEVKDPCEDDSCDVDSCGNDVECHKSTRGERLVTEADKCKRC